MKSLGCSAYGSAKDRDSGHLEKVKSYYFVNFNYLFMTDIYCRFYDI